MVPLLLCSLRFKSCSVLYRETHFGLSSIEEKKHLEVVKEVWGLPLRQAAIPRYRAAERNLGLGITYLVLTHIFIVT